MGSANGSSGSRVRDVVREVVAELAPDELLVVDGLFRLGDAKAVRRLRGRGRRREPLGFGVGDVVVLVTPVVWLALNQAAQRVADVAVDGAAKGMRDLLRRLFRRWRAPVTVPPLTPGQLGEVRRLVLQNARQHGMSERRAAEIANEVVTRLVLVEADTPAIGSGTGQDPRS